MLRRLFSSWLLASTALAQLYPGALDPNGNPIPSYSPLRPPAVPLAVRGPYTSAWTSTAGNGTLNSAGAIFWPGNAVGWEGIILVDGIAYQYLGVGAQVLPALPNLREAVPTHVVFDSQWSNFTFTCGAVEVMAGFFSPVIPQDLCRSSIPLSYLYTEWTSTDGKSHDVSLYSDVNGAWISYESNATITWNLFEGDAAVNGSAHASNNPDDLYSWIFQLETQYEFAEEYQFPSWGNFTYTSAPSPSAKNFSFESGFSASLRYNFVMGHGLDDIVDPNYRGWGSSEPVFAFAHDFGSASSGNALYTIGTYQEPVVRYLTTDGVLPLQPWWSKCYGDVFQLIAFHYGDFNTSVAKGAAFEAQLKADIDAYYKDNMAYIYSNGTEQPMPSYGSNGSEGYVSGTDQFGQAFIFDPNNAAGFLNPNNFSGIAIPDLQEAENYYAIVALSARQVMGAYTWAIPPDLPNLNSSLQAVNNLSEPLLFQKEISSDGNVNTVDVMFPASPFFLYANPDLLKYSMNPLYYNQRSGFYPNGYSMHDLGPNYPNATGEVAGDDEYMPVEESGNMLLMSLAYYKFTGDTAWITANYQKMQGWASYLIDFSLIPGYQVSTDDFAGPLANQTNLAIKGIVGLQAMSEISTVVGDTASAANYSATAADYFEQWKYLAIDPSGKHTTLGYEWRSSWSLLYNTFPSKLLNLGIIPDSLFQMQSDWYPTVSQIYGVPLDNRHAYTKSDESMMTAATCSPSTRRLFVNAIAYWLNYTSTPYAFSDLFNTISDGYYPEDPLVEFVARPVVGGHYSLLALYRAGLTDASGTGEAGTVFSVNSTDHLSLSSAGYLTVTAYGGGVANETATLTTTVKLSTASANGTSSGVIASSATSSAS